jgi:hypothetical protein
MNMWHPLAGFQPETLTWLFMLLLIATVLFFFWLESTGRRLRTAEAPLGIVSLELADTPERARQIIDSWGETARDAARRNLSMDFVFIPLYTTLLAVAGIMASRWFVAGGYVWMGNLAVALAWGQWIAGLFDAAENCALLRTLQVHPDIPDGLPQMSSWCARIKFLLIIAAVFFSLFGLATSLA